MTSPSTNGTPGLSIPAQGSPFGDVVVPGGFFDRLLKSIDRRPRKHRWNCYLRACKRIPKSSPLYGCTDWKKINARRGMLIDKDFQKSIAMGDAWTPGTRTWFDTDTECIALQNVADAIVTSCEVAQSFRLRRTANRLMSALPKKNH